MQFISPTALCLVLSFSSCTNAQNNFIASADKPAEDTIQQSSVAFTFDTAASGLNFQPSADYTSAKTSITEMRSTLKARYLSLTDSLSRITFLDSVSNVFTEKLLNEIIPYWYGTPWDFNGCTAVPNDGEIACGYFVSTTLRDMGVLVNRYKLAQQGGLQEAKSIAMSAANLVPSVSQSKLLERLKQFSPGLYFVGLDYHVGFLYLHKGQRFFIHSNFYEDKVMTENADYSPGFASNRYCFAKITGNHSLALSWLMEKEMKVVMP